MNELKPGQTVVLRGTDRRYIIESIYSTCPFKKVDTPLPKGEWILELTTALSGFPYLGLTLLCPIRAD